MTRNRLKKQQGATLVELLMVLALVAVFGVCLFSLIFAGSNAYHRLEDSRTVEGDARVAVSFISVKLRQNDAAGCVQVMPLDNGKNALLLTDPGESGAQTWIFFDKGVLYECLVAEGMPPEIGTANVIAQLEDCDIRMEGESIRVSVAYLRDGQIRHMESTVSVRSKGQR